MGMTVGRRLMAIFFPERCAACGDVIVAGEGLCSVCRNTMPRIGVPVCPLCGLEKEWCDCKRRRRHYERVVAPWYYDGKGKDAVLRMKASGDPVAVSFFAEELADTVRQYYEEIPFDGVVFVPCTRRERRRRGYNPGEMVARATAKALELPLWPCLTKLIDTPSQKTLSAERRTGNLLGVFDVVDELVADKTLLLVDDVVTTGATLDECAKMLKIYGARAVYAATVAATRKQKE